MYTPVGTKTHETKLNIKIKNAEKKKSILLLLCGNIFSFNINLNPSTNDWSKPNQPSLFGPALL